MASFSFYRILLVIGLLAPLVSNANPGGISGINLGSYLNEDSIFDSPKSDSLSKNPTLDDFMGFDLDADHPNNEAFLNPEDGQGSETVLNNFWKKARKIREEASNKLAAGEKQVREEVGNAVEVVKDPLKAVREAKAKIDTIEKNSLDQLSELQKKGQALLDGLDAEFKKVLGPVYQRAVNWVVEQREALNNQIKDSANQTIADLTIKQTAKLKEHTDFKDQVASDLELSEKGEFVKSEDMFSNLNLDYEMLLEELLDISALLKDPSRLEEFKANHPETRAFLDRLRLDELVKEIQEFNSTFEENKKASSEEWKSMKEKIRDFREVKLEELRTFYRDQEISLQRETSRLLEELKTQALILDSSLYSVKLDQLKLDQAKFEEASLAEYAKLEVQIENDINAYQSELTIAFKRNQDKRKEDLDQKEEKVLGFIAQVKQSVEQELAKEKEKKQSKINSINEKLSQGLDTEQSDLESTIDTLSTKSDNTFGELVKPLPDDGSQTSTDFFDKTDWIAIKTSADTQRVKNEVKAENENLKKDLEGSKNVAENVIKALDQYISAVDEIGLGINQLLLSVAKLEDPIPAIKKRINNARREKKDSYMKMWAEKIASGLDDVGMELSKLDPDGIAGHWAGIVSNNAAELEKVIRTNAEVLSSDLAKIETRTRNSVSKYYKEASEYLDERYQASLGTVNDYYTKAEKAYKTQVENVSSGVKLDLDVKFESLGNLESVNLGNIDLSLSNVGRELSNIGSVTNIDFSKSVNTAFSGVASFGQDVLFGKISLDSIEQAATDAKKDLGQLNPLNPDSHVSKVGHEIGIRPADFRESLSDTHENFRQQGEAAVKQAVKDVKSEVERLDDQLVSAENRGRGFVKQSAENAHSVNVFNPDVDKSGGIERARENYLEFKQRVKQGGEDAKSDLGNYNPMKGDGEFQQGLADLNRDLAEVDPTNSNSQVSNVAYNSGFRPKDFIQQGKQEISNASDRLADLEKLAKQGAEDLKEDVGGLNPLNEDSHINKVAHKHGVRPKDLIDEGVEGYHNALETGETILEQAGKEAKGVYERSGVQDSVGKVDGALVDADDSAHQGVVDLKRDAAGLNPLNDESHISQVGYDIGIRPQDAAKTISDIAEQGRQSAEDNLGVLGSDIKDAYEGSDLDKIVTKIDQDLVEFDEGAHQGVVDLKRDLAGLNIFNQNAHINKVLWKLGVRPGDLSEEEKTQIVISIAIGYYIGYAIYANDVSLYFGVVVETSKGPLALYLNSQILGSIFGVGAALATGQAFNSENQEDDDVILNVNGHESRHDIDSGVPQPEPIPEPAIWTEEAAMITAVLDVMQRNRIQAAGGLLTKLNEFLADPEGYQPDETDPEAMTDLVEEIEQSLDPSNTEDRQILSTFATNLVVNRILGIDAELGARLSGDPTQEDLDEANRKLDEYQKRKEKEPNQSDPHEEMWKLRLAISQLDSTQVMTGDVLGGAAIYITSWLTDSLILASTTPGSNSYNEAAARYEKNMRDLGKALGNYTFIKPMLELYFGREVDIDGLIDASRDGVNLSILGPEKSKGEMVYDFVQVGLEFGTGGIAAVGGKLSKAAKNSKVVKQAMDQAGGILESAKKIQVEAATAGGKVTDIMKLRHRSLELGIERGELKIVEGIGGARYELATGRKIKRPMDGDSDIDFIDDAIGPFDLKGPIRHTDTGNPIEITDKMVTGKKGLANAALKDINYNTASKATVIDTLGLTPKQIEALKQAIENGKKTNKRIIFLE